MIPSSIRVAVLVPCFNEEATVATVVADFRRALPSAEIFVCDNNATDRTLPRRARGRGPETGPRILALLDQKPP